MSERGVDDGLSHADRMVLATIINPHHLSSDAIADAHNRLHQHANRHVVIDDFLLPAHLPQLRALVNSRGAFDVNLKVHNKGESVAHLAEAERRARVDRDLFESVPDKDRFISQEIYSGSSEQGGDQRPAQTDALVRKIFNTAQMHLWLSAISGHALGATLPINLKRHGPGHFLRRHSDATGGRKICGVVYLHDDWRRDYGGRFLLYREDGSHFAIDPLPNRLVLFDVTVKNDHAIEELKDVPAGWWRSNYSIWFR